MSTPHCFICGRWDGSHSGGCPQTGQPYVGTFTLPQAEPQLAHTSPWVQRATTSTLPFKDLTEPWDQPRRSFYRVKD